MFKGLMSAILRMATLLALATAAVLARPQGGGGGPHYDVSYSGGSWSTTGPSASDNGVYSGTPAYGANVGTGGVYNASGPGSAYCSGMITATFTWNSAGNPTNLPPPVALVKKVSTAAWAGDLGTCSNGLGSPVVPGEYGAIATGVAYEVRNNPGLSFTVTCAPSASASQISSPPSGFLGGSANVGFAAQAFGVSVDLLGVIDPVSARRLLIGQRLGFRVNLGGFTDHQSEEETWQIAGGMPFAAYNGAANGPSATITPWQPITSFGGYGYAYFRFPAPGIVISASVTLTFADPGVPQLTCQVSNTCEAEAPARYTDQRTIGTMQLLDESFNPSSDPSRFVLHGATIPGAGKTGVFQLFWTSTPAAYSPSGNYGSFFAAQLVTTANKATYAGVLTNVPDPPASGLDHSFPYTPAFEASPRPAGASRVFDDRPGLADAPGARLRDATPLHAENTFCLHLMYLPPESAAGPSAPVSTQSYNWRNKGDATYTNGQWIVQDTGSAFTGFITLFPPQPTWNMKVNP